MAEIATHGEVTANEALVISAIASGTYFVFEETPSGTIDGVNATFTLAQNPNPNNSLELRLNGSILKSGAGNDFTLSETTITMFNIPQPGDILTATYTVSPV